MPHISRNSILLNFMMTIPIGNLRDEPIRQELRWFCQVVIERSSAPNNATRGGEEETAGSAWISRLGRARPREAWRHGAYRRTGQPRNHNRTIKQRPIQAGPT
jgi:hypothetical protein